MADDNEFRVKLFISDNEKSIVENFVKQLAETAKVLDRVSGRLTRITNKIDGMGSGPIVRGAGTPISGAHGRLLGNMEDYAFENDEEDLIDMPKPRRRRRRVSTSEVKTAAEVNADAIEKTPDAEPLAYSSHPQGRFTRQAVIGGEMGRNSRILPPIGTMTTQQILNLGSDVSSELGWEREEDPNNPGIYRVKQEPVLGADGNPMTDEAGNPMMRAVTRNLGGLGAGARFLSGGLGMLARTLPAGLGAMTAARTAQQVIGQVYGGSRAGMQMGYEPGIFGAGASNRFGGLRDAALESWFGFNPYMGFGQAREINAAVEGLGYRGDQRSAMFHTLSGLTEQTGVDTKLAASLMDQIVRYGSGSLAEFNVTMRQIPSAAQAANMSVKEFQQQMQTVATNIAQKYAQPVDMIASQITQSSAATGFTPAVTGELVSNQLQTILEAQRNGMTPGQWLNDPRQRFLQPVQGPADMFKAITGGRDLKDLRFDKSLQEFVQTFYAYGNGRQIFGMDYNTLLRQANDTNATNRVEAQMDLETLSSRTSHQTADRATSLLIGENGKTMSRLDDPTAFNQFIDRISGDLATSGVNKDKISAFESSAQNRGRSSKDIQKDLEDARRLLSSNEQSQRQSVNVKTDVEVHIKPATQQLLDRIISTSDLSTAPTSPKDGRNWHVADTASWLSDVPTSGRKTADILTLGANSLFDLGLGG